MSVTSRVQGPTRAAGVRTALARVRQRAPRRAEAPPAAVAYRLDAF